LCSLLGLILGIVALSRVKKSGRGGRGLAIAAIIISLLSMVGGGIIFANRASSQPAQAARSDSGSITTGGSVPANQLRTGDCINYPSSTATAIQSLDAVPCSQPHDGEAYANAPLPLTGSWPGNAAVMTAAQTECRNAFQAFVGISPDTTTLSVIYLYPQQVNWEAGDRGYVCLVGDKTKTTGTLQGAAR